MTETYWLAVNGDAIHIEPADIREDVLAAKCEQLQDALFAERRKYRRQTLWLIAWAVLAYWVGVFSNKAVVSVYHYLLRWAA